MNIIKSREMVQNLRNNAIPEEQRTIYFWLFFVFIGGYLLSRYPGETPEAQEWIDVKYIIQAAIFSVGLFYCGQKNQQADNKDFIVRFVCLAVPIGLQMILLFGVALLLLHFVLPGFYTPQATKFMLPLFANIFFFREMAVCFKLFADKPQI